MGGERKDGRKGWKSRYLVFKRPVVHLTVMIVCEIYLSSYWLLSQPVGMNKPFILILPSCRAPCRKLSTWIAQLGSNEKDYCLVPRKKEIGAQKLKSFPFSPIPEPMSLPFCAPMLASRRRSEVSTIACQKDEDVAVIASVGGWSRRFVYGISLRLKNALDR